MDRDLTKDIMLICNWDKCDFDLNQMTVHKGHNTEPCFTEQDKLTLPWVFKINLISKLGEQIKIQRISTHQQNLPELCFPVSVTCCSLFVVDVL